MAHYLVYNVSVYLGKAPALIALPPLGSETAKSDKLTLWHRLWYLYNIEPIEAWKMFRTASALWQTYNLKHRRGIDQRSAEEKSKSRRETQT